MGGESFYTDVSGTTFTNTGSNVANGIPYYYQVTAVNASGESARSNEVSATPRAAQVTLALYVHEGSASGPVLSGAQVTGQDGVGVSFNQTTNSSGYVVISGAPGTWSFTASKAGYRSESWTQAITATDRKDAFLQRLVTAPSAPQNLWVTATGDRSVSLAWDPPGNDGGSPITGYRLYRGTSPGGEVFYSDAGGTTFTNTGSNVANGITYYYQVTATNASGESPRSNEVSATPRAAQVTLIPEVLSPVEGPLEIFNSDANCRGNRWCFNQHMSDGHARSGGVGEADDTLAWDVNLNAPRKNSDAGVPVFAVAPGIVAKCYGDRINADHRCDDGRLERGTRGQVLIEHINSDGSKWWSGYLHLGDIQVAPGQRITENTTLGFISSVGANNDHLHFAVYTGSNIIGGLVSFNVRVRERLGRDRAAPTVDAFSVSPTVVEAGQAFTISYTVSDAGGSGLKQVELWGSASPDKWPERAEQTAVISGVGSGPYSGVFTDKPLTTGAWWYGIHVVDNAGNWNDERNSRSGGSPGSFGPIQVTVTEQSENTLTVECVGRGTVQPQGCNTSKPYLLGSPILLLAEAENGYFFSGWTDDCQGLSPCFLMVSGHKRVTASFVEATSAPTITQIEPASGAPGIRVTLRGKGFVSIFPLQIVTFGGKGATIVQWSDTEIVAVTPSGDGTVDVVAGPSPKSNTVQFTYLPPHVESVVPDSGGPGTTVTIRGTNFGEREAGGLSLGYRVRLGKSFATATIKTWSDKVIVLEAPTDYGTGENNRQLIEWLLKIALAGYTEDIPGLIRDALEALLAEGVKPLPAQNRIEVLVTITTPAGEDGTGKFTYQVEDDHGGSMDTATAVSTGSTPGVIRFPADLDFFRFSAQRGLQYTIEVRLGTHPDTVLSLLDASGNILATNDDARGELGLGSRIVWTPSASGDYFLRVNSFNQRTQTGTYTLALRAERSQDDHGNSPDDATRITPGNTAGTISPAADVDFFRFSAQAGGEYTIEVRLGTHPDTVLTLYDTRGNVLLESDDALGELGRGSRIVWKALSNGDYFLRVRSWSQGSGVGSYILSLAIRTVPTN